jgi:two-component system cell cycle response regulator CtrA
MAASPQQAPSLIRTGDLVIDPAAKRITVGGEPVRLKLKEWQLIELMSLRKDTVLTRRMLLDHLYGGVDHPEIKIVDIIMDKLQRKLAHSTARIVETSSGDGIGFRLIGPPASRGRRGAPEGPPRGGDVRDE